MKHVIDFIRSNCKFAQTVDPSQSWISGSDDTALFNEIKSLHELWYLYNGLITKNSDIALRKAEEAKANFYVVAQKVIKKIDARFRKWINDHVMPGWGKRWAEMLDEYHGNYNYPLSPQVFCPDLQNYIAPIVAANMIEEDDMGGYLDEYLMNQENYIESFSKQQNLDTKAVQEELKDLGPLFEQYKKYVSNLTNNFIDLYDPRNIDHDWINQELYKNRVINTFNSDTNAQNVGFACFIKSWPDYISIAKTVQQALARLNATDMSDINAVMSSISLALNTAHNTGVMAEHVGLTDNDLDQLSNQDVSKQDTQLKRFMSKEFRFLA